MVIGRFRPRESKPTSLKAALAIGIDEALTALEECIHDLTDEQAWARPSPRRHAIATIMMHVIGNFDYHACFLQTGKPSLEHDHRFDIYDKPEPDRPDRQENLPTVREMVDRLHTLREAVMAGLETAEEADLLGPRAAVDTQWWKERHRSAASAYTRVTWHSTAHVRQIWALRGLMGLADEHGWPQQHYH
ncbi:MAG: DinB family protein [Phycisphaerae bacterium]|nr:DinB family protein [Phycisphaerae bacterium]